MTVPVFVNYTEIAITFIASKVYSLGKFFKLGVASPTVACCQLVTWVF